MTIIHNRLLLCQENIAVQDQQYYERRKRCGFHAIRAAEAFVYGIMQDPKDEEGVAGQSYVAKVFHLFL